MRILYLSQYFPPEAGATQTRAHEMARAWVRLGDQVTMIAEIPNHPSGVVPPEYRGKLLEHAELDGIDVIRVWVKTSPRKNFLTRMLFYLSYMVNAILAGLLLARGRYDLIYASSPPLFTGGAALALSYLRRLPLVFEVRDLWPESAVALGELNNRRAIALAERLEAACYRRARRIVVVTQSVRRRLIARGLAPEKIVLIPNGANPELFQFRPARRARLRAELGLKEAFVAVYAGIYGLAQGLEIVIEAARLLQDRPVFRFLLIGAGPRRDELAALVQQYGLTNLLLLDEVSRESVPDYLSAGDVALVPLRKLEVFTEVLPSKLFDAWACERPVVLGVNGEARAVLEAAGGGLHVQPEDPAALASALVQLQADPQLRAEMGRRGRAYTEAHYSRQALAEQLNTVLHFLFASPPAGHK